MKVNEVRRPGVKESERTRKKGEGSLAVKHVNIRKKSLLSRIHPHPPAHAIHAYLWLYATGGERGKEVLDRRWRGRLGTSGRIVFSQGPPNQRGYQAQFYCFVRLWRLTWVNQDKAWLEGCRAAISAWTAREAQRSKHRDPWYRAIACCVNAQRIRERRLRQKKLTRQQPSPQAPKATDCWDTAILTELTATLRTYQSKRSRTPWDYALRMRLQSWKLRQQESKTISQ